MFRPRIIPVLLVSNGQLVKSIQFKDHRYIGDPINAARLFSEMGADELIVLDIDATRNGTVVSSELIQQMSTETHMPIGVGGGIKSLNDIERCIQSGAEKIVIGTSIFENPNFLRSAAAEFGSSTISVCIDVNTSSDGLLQVRYLNGTKTVSSSLSSITKRIEQEGAGEIILQSINKDGSRSGYDIDLIKTTSQGLQIPIVALGGANSLDNLKKAYNSGMASAMAASSIFIYQGNGVLISYPEQKEIQHLFID